MYARFKAYGGSKLNASACSICIYRERFTSDIKGNHLTSMHLPLSTREDVKQVEHKMGSTSEPSTLICYIFQGCLWIINCRVLQVINEHSLKKATHTLKAATYWISILPSSNSCSVAAPQNFHVTPFSYLYLSCFLFFSFLFLILYFTLYISCHHVSQFLSFPHLIPVDVSKLKSAT